MKKPARPPPRKAPAPPPVAAGIQEDPLADKRFHFQLYVTGNTPRSTAAVANLRALCDEHLDGRYDLEVIDIYQEPARASTSQIIASPTLIKLLPKPLLRIVGNLADQERLRLRLNLSTPPPAATTVPT